MCFKQLARKIYENRGFVLGVKILIAVLAGYFACFLIFKSRNLPLAEAGALSFSLSDEGRLQVELPGTPGFFEDPSIFQVKSLKVPQRVKIRILGNCKESVLEQFRLIHLEGDCKVLVTPKSPNTLWAIKGKVELVSWYKAMFVVAFVISALLFTFHQTVILCGFFTVVLGMVTQYNYTHCMALIFSTIVFLAFLKYLDLKGSERVSVLEKVFCLGVFIVSVLLKVALILKTSTFTNHADEFSKLVGVQAYVSNTWDKHISEVLRNRYLHPPFMIKAAGFATSLLTESPTQAQLAVFSKLPNLIAFIFTALAIFFISRKVFGVAASYWALAIFSCSLLPALTTSSLKEDNLFVCFFSLAILSVLKYVNSEKLVWLILSGIFCGFSFGSKYSGLLSLLVCFTAITYWRLLNFKFSFGNVSKLFRSFFILVIFSALGFFALNHDLFSNFNLYKRGFLLESMRVSGDHGGLFLAGKDFLYFFLFKEVFLELENFILGVLLVISLTLYLKGSFWQKFFVLGFVLVYFVFEHSSGKPPPQHHRYLLPGYIFAIPLVGGLIGSTSQAFKILGVIFCLFNTLITISLSVKKDTAEAALDFLKKADLKTHALAVTGYVIPNYLFSSLPDLIEIITPNTNINEVLAGTKKDLVIVGLSSFKCDRFFWRAPYTLAHWKGQIQCKLYLQDRPLIQRFHNAIVKKPFFNPDIYFVVWSTDDFIRVNRSIESFSRRK